MFGSKMQNISTSSNKYRLFSSSSFFYNLFLLWVHSGPNPVTSLALEIVKGTDWWSLPTGTRVTIAARGIGLASIAMRGWIESAKWPRKKTFNLSSRCCNGLAYTGCIMKCWQIIKKIIFIINGIQYLDIAEEIIKKFVFFFGSDLTVMY